MALEKGTHQSVHRSIRLIIDAATLALPILNSSINQTLISRLVGRSKDKRRVGRRILGLIDIDRYPVLIRYLI